MPISNKDIQNYLANPNILIKKYNKMPIGKNKDKFKKDLQDAVKNLSMEYNKKTLTTAAKAFMKGFIELLHNSLPVNGTNKLTEVKFLEINKLFKKNMKLINSSTDLELSDDIPLIEIFKRL